MRNSGAAEGQLAMASRNENRPLFDEPRDAMFAGFALLESWVRAERRDAVAASDDLYGALSYLRLIGCGIVTTVPGDGVRQPHARHHTAISKPGDAGRQLQ